MIIVSHKKAGIYIFYRKYIYGKTTGGAKLTPNLIKFTENPLFQLAICKFADFQKLHVFYELFIFTSIRLISQNV